MTDATRIVDVQLDAYNARNIDAFVATYADDVELFSFPDKLNATGHEKLRAIYGEMFNNVPDLNAKITGRVAIGPFVIDREHVTGFPKGPLEAIAIYEVRDGKIRRVWFMQ